MIAGDASPDSAVQIQHFGEASVTRGVDAVRHVGSQVVTCPPFGGRRERTADCRSVERQLHLIRDETVLLCLSPPRN